MRGQATSHLEPPILSMEVLRHLWLETDPTAMWGVGVGAGRSPEDQHWWEIVALMED